MAAKLLFCDSFDHYTLPQMAGKWTNGGGGSFTYLVVGRTNNAYQTLFDTGVTIPGGGRDNITIGAYRTSNTAGALSGQFKIAALAGQCAAISFNGDGTVSAQNAAGTTVATSTKVAVETNVGHYIELGVLCDPTNGQIIVRVDGEELINISSVNTRSNAYYVSIAGTGGGTATTYDDLYMLWDDASTISFYDDVEVRAISPNSNGNYAQWTPSAGSNYETVDEQPASTAEYNATNVVNEIDTFNFPDLTFTGTVKGVQFVVYASKSEVEIRAIRGVCRIAGVDYLSSNTEYLSTNNSFYRFVWEVNPATTAAWTQAEVNAAEFGYKLVV